MKGEVKKKADSKDFKQALIKKALGYNTTEVIEEYVANEDGDIKLSKKKVTLKNVPPDITAIKLLMDGEEQLCNLTDEQLIEEKKRLLELLAKKTKSKKEN